MKDKTLKRIFAVSLVAAIMLPLISILFIYPAFTKQLLINTEDEAIRTGAHFARMYFDESSVVTKESISNEIINNAHHLMRDYELMKIKVFAPSGEIVYSTEQKEIGNINKKPYYHEIVANGKPFTKLVKKETESLEGQNVSADVVETYVPIVKNGTFAGALELYYNVTQRVKSLNKLIFYASLAPLIFMFAFLASVVFIIIRSAKDQGASFFSRNAFRYRSPHLSLLIITLLVIVFESVAMVLIQAIPSLSDVERTVLDVFILIMFLTPTIFIFLVQPLMRYNAELSRAEQDLKESQLSLVNDHKELQKIFSNVENAKLEWEKTVDCVSDIIIRTDRDGKITRFNKALQEVTGKKYDEIIGYHWEDFITDYELEVTTLFDTSTELFHEPTGKWFMLNSYPFYDKDEQYLGNVITINDNTETKTLEEAIVQDNARLEKTQQELKDAYDELKSAQSQMLQKEKMASIGQLAAGVAHEINNPMGFISSNISSLGRYTKKIAEFIHVQDEAIASADLPELSTELNEKRKKLKLDFVLEDIDQLIEESLDGADRVKKIVQNLKSFSRIDEADHQAADINECLESTLNIVWNEIKYKATVSKDYGELPMTNCYPQQLNQVFMNLLVNAAHAIEKEGEITIKTWNGDDYVHISISDTGEGIPGDKMNKIFEPFYTTKPVGKGTGLGLSITYDIIKKHKGEMSVDSEVGQGTTFTIKIPVAGKDTHG